MRLGRILIALGAFVDRRDDDVGLFGLLDRLAGWLGIDQGLAFDDRSCFNDRGDFSDRSGLDHGRCRGGSLGSFLGFASQTLLFTLATAHFTGVVRCTAIAAGHGCWRRLLGRRLLDDRCGFHDRCSCRFSFSFGCGRWLGDDGGFGQRRFGKRFLDSGCFDDGGLAHRFGDDSWLLGNGFENRRLLTGLLDFRQCFDRQVGALGDYGCRSGVLGRGGAGGSAATAAGA